MTSSRDKQVLYRESIKLPENGPDILAAALDGMSIGIRNASLLLFPLAHGVLQKTGNRFLLGLNNMKAIVVSDLHLGSAHFLSLEFENLLRSLPKGFDLVLNGDVLDDCNNSLNPSHQQVLELVRLESYHRRVIWVRGNHDESCPMSKLGEISFKSEHAYDTQLLIIHGHKIDNVRKIVRGFLRIRDFIASIGRNRINLEICVTKIHPLYKWYRSYLMRRAVSYARKKGFRTIACGHTHYPEDKITDGIRYINTGAWTKWPPFYLLVNNGEMSLRALRR